MDAGFVRHITPLLLLVAVTGCMDQPEGLAAKADANSDKSLVWPTFGSPITPANSSTVLIPFGVESPLSQSHQSFSPSAGFVSQGVSSVGFGSYFGDDHFFDTSQIRWNNVVFYDKKTGKSHLLLDRRVVICRFMAPDNKDDKKIQSPGYFLFAIADADTNGDGAINENDALVLYVSDAAGNNLTPVTPPMTHFQSVWIDPDDNSLYVQIMIDSRGDHNFTADGPTTILRVDPLHPAQGTAISPEDLRQRAFHIVMP